MNENSKSKLNLKFYQNSNKWIKYLYYALLVPCSIYVFILFLKAATFAGFSYLAGDHPILLVSYISLLHLIAIPILHYSVTRDMNLYLVFLVINGIWLLAVPVLIIFIYKRLAWTVKLMFKANPLHHLLLFSYFVNALILQILVYLTKLEVVEAQPPTEPVKDAKSKLVKKGK